MRDYRVIGPSALLGVLAGFPAVGVGQEQSTPPNQTTLEEVVVTGTSIRGAAPVGSNLITVGRAEIEASGAQTLAQVLRSVPAVTGFGSSGAGAVGQGGGGAGGFQSFDGAGSYTPTIHGLGASASNGTLILVDGHRLPLSGINHTLADPSVIAPLAIERVEILPDGASAVYGSDAVAGVLNFITRRKYDGFEGNLQASFGDGYNTQSAGFITGLSGEQGSAMFTYNYSTRGNLSGRERPYTAANHIPQGGGNFANFNCAPASVSPATGQPGAGLIFAAPYTGAGVANVAANSFCDFSADADIIPEDDRHNLMLKLERDINDSLTLTADFIYARQRNITRINRGSVTATVFGPGSTPAGGAGQINPFFAGPAGVNAETVRFQADELFGPGAQFVGGAESLFGTFAADYNLGARLARGVRLDDRSGRQPAEARRCTLRELRAACLERHDEHSRQSRDAVGARDDDGRARPSAHGGQCNRCLVASGLEPDVRRAAQPAARLDAAADRASDHQRLHAEVRRTFVRPARRRSACGRGWRVHRVHDA